MIIKTVSLIAAFLMLFINTSVELKESVILNEDGTSLTSGRINDEIIGAGGTRFYIQRPSNTSNIVYAEDFGLSEACEDNFNALQKAIDFCKGKQGATLLIKKGTYYFKSEQTISIDGCSDLLIDAQGATFIFSSPGYKFRISNSDCVEITNLSVDWAWQEKPLASIVTISESDPDNNKLNLVFKNPEYCSEDNALMVLTQCDPDTLTFGARGTAKEVYLYSAPDLIKSVKKINDNTLQIVHDGYLKLFENGETYILRHFCYGGTIFHLVDYSKNITFDNVNIFGGTGMGYICEGNSSHFQIINSKIGINPQYKETRCISTTADAIHIANTNGCFNVSGCDISAMGDDAVNVHDGSGYVADVNGDTLLLTASAMRLEVGDILSFKDESFKDTDITAKILSVTQSQGINKLVSVQILTGEGVKNGFVAYNTACDSSNYVISNNYIHENRARGLLLQSSNGLVENNRFYKTMGQTIKIVMDIEPTLWQEGIGCDNIIIRNNTFDSCSYSKWGGIIEIGTNLDGKSADGYVFSNIEIYENEFVNISSELLLADNVNGLIIKNNTVNIGSLFDKDSAQGKICLAKNCANIIYNSNHFSKPIRAIVKSKSVAVWAQANSQLY